MAVLSAYALVIIINCKCHVYFTTEIRLKIVIKYIEWGLLYNFEAFKGIAVFLHFLILSFFFKIGCTVDSTKPDTLQILKWYSHM